MPPVVIAAGVAGVAGIGAAALGASAQSKAAKSASNSAAATAASNNALQSQVRADNKAILSPYVTRGNAAGGAINDLLGLGGGGQTPQQYGAPMSEEWANGALSSMGLGSRGDSLGTLQAHLSGSLEGPLSPQMMSAYENYQGTHPNQGAVTGAAPQNAQNAFSNYLNSTGYQFQMDQGTNAINSGYAAGGTLQSGDAMKALQTYGQNTGKAYFSDYLGQLGNQQNIGLSGANALAGVGTNFANQTSANNNAAGTAQQNAMLASGSAQAGLYGNIAGAIGGVANAYASSYRPTRG